jgi:hypothetical protein
MPNAAIALAPEPQRARLRIEGVRAPIVTNVERRAEGGLVVVQDLPFLRLNASVSDEDDRAARIAWVSVDVDGGVPRLVLELAYEDPDPALAPRESTIRRKRRDPTIGYEQKNNDERRKTRRDDQSSIVFTYDPSAERPDPSQRTTQPWMESRGSEVVLWWRSLKYRVKTAIESISAGFARARAALRGEI